MTNFTKCDGCQRPLKKEEQNQAQIWNASTTIDLNTTWVKGSIIDLCANCFDKIVDKEKKNE